LERILKLLTSRLKKLILYYAFSTLKARKRAALRWIRKIRLSDWIIVEIGLGCRLKNSKIRGSSFIPVKKSTVAAELELPQADLTVFLDLADELQEKEFAALLAQIPSHRILFSFTEKKHKSLLIRNLYRRLPIDFSEPVCYHSEEITRLLSKNGFRHCEIRRLPFLIPTRLVLAEKSGRLPKAMRNI